MGNSKRKDPLCLNIHFYKNERIDEKMIIHKNGLRKSLDAEEEML